MCRHPNNHGVDFVEHRAYQPGDKPKNIDWRMTAKMQSPWVKVCHEENNHSIHLLLDLTTSLFFSSKSFCKSVIAVEIFALLGWQATDSGNKVSGIIITAGGIIHLPAGRGEQHFYHLLRQVTDIYKRCLYTKKHLLQNNYCFTHAIAILTQKKTTDIKLVLISDFLSVNNSTLTRLRVALSKTNISAFRINDPMETGECPPGFYPVSNGSEITSLICINKKTQNTFNTQAKQHFNKKKHYFSQQGIVLYELSTQCSALKQLICKKKQLYEV